MSDRYIPTSVRKQLRQEAYFGCAQCGAPILEYHHIIPWAERQHHEPEHMIALCPTHHRSLAKMARKKCYDLKMDPFNKKNNILHGCLGTENFIDRFVIGSNTFINTPNIFVYFEQPLISYKVEDGQFLLSIYMPDENYWPSLKIVDNEMIFNRFGAWDFEFRTNYLKLHRVDGTFFEIDLRGESALLAGSFIVGGEAFEFTPDATKIANMTISHCTFTNCGGGIKRGDGQHKIHWPNYAMTFPRATYTRL